MLGQLFGNIKVVLGHHLVAGGFFRVGRQPVVLKGVNGQPGHVLHRQVNHRMLGDRGVAVAQDPPLVEIGRLFFADLLRDLVEGFGAAGGHGEGHRDLFFA